MDSYETSDTVLDSDAQAAECDLHRRDAPGLNAVGLIADIFIEDMLRLERDHGLKASEMLAYYKGEFELDKND